MNNQDLDLARLAIEFGLTGQTELRRPTINVLLALIDELEERRGKQEPEPEIDVEFLCALNAAHEFSTMASYRKKEIKVFIEKGLLESKFYIGPRFVLTKKGFDLLKLTISDKDYNRAVEESRHIRASCPGVYVP